MAMTKPTIGNASPRNHRATDMITLAVVEDHSLVRLGLVNLLEQDAHLNVVADLASGEECLQFLKGQQPDVLLLDIGLPGINGLETARVVLDNYPDTKIIILTSHEEREHVIEAFSIGVHAYCLKSVDRRLVDLIYDVNEGAYWLDSSISVHARDILTTMAQRQVQQHKRTDDYSDGDIELLKMVAEGKNNTIIARMLDKPLHVIKFHLKDLFQKLDVEDRTQAAVRAVRMGLI